MSTPISRLWFLGPPVAILISLLAYYAKFPSMRHWVDSRFPWVAENVGSHLPALVDESPTPPSKSKTVQSRPAVESQPPVRSEAAPEAPQVLAPPVAPTFVAPDGTVDMQKLAVHRNAWPQTVVLKKAKEFPAVVNGKAVGKVEVPAGTEARLVSIQDGKLGLEYQGGGAWLTVEETDLAQRLPH